MTRKLPLLIGSLSLVVVFIFGTLFVIRAAQNAAAKSEPVFERIDAAQTEATEVDSPESTEGAVETDPEPQTTDTKANETPYYFDEDAYLSRRLKVAAEIGEPQAAAVEETVVETTAAYRSTGRYLRTTVVAQFRKEGYATAETWRQLWAGEEVFELRTDGEWSNVRDAAGVEGYVAASLLTDLTVTAETEATPTTAVATRAATISPTTATAAPTVAYSSVNRTRYVRDGVVNVRQSDSVYSLKLAELPVGSRVTEIAVGPEWSKIRLNDDRTGFVLTSLLSADPGTTSTVAPTSAPTSAPVITNPPTSAPTVAPTSPAPTAPAFTAVDKIQYIVPVSANVRTAASTSASIMLQLAQGTAVRVTGIGTGWSRVSLNSGIGYISSALLSDTKPVQPTTPPTAAPTTPPTAAPTSPPAGGLNFVQPGSASAAVTNFGKIAPYLRPNGDKNYYSFTDNGNNTITVDGLTLSYQYAQSYGMTHYDGLAVSVAMGENPPRNRSTATGIPAQRGLIAMKLPVYGGLPFGTVVFVEGYGLAVLADRGSLSSKTQVDLCYNAGESAYVRTYGWAMQKMYVISIP